MERWRQWLESDDGQAMVEYALLVSLVSMAALAVILLAGPAISNAFRFVVNGLATL